MHTLQVSQIFKKRTPSKDPPGFVQFAVTMRRFPGGILIPVPATERTSTGLVGHDLLVALAVDGTVVGLVHLLFFAGHGCSQSSNELHH